LRVGRIRLPLAWILFMAAFLRMAALSGYRLVESDQVSWDGAILLTPWGIFRNLILSQGSPLVPYYHQLAARRGFIAEPALLVLDLFVVVLSLVLLRRHLRRAR
jgi:hypothetical protein